MRYSLMILSCMLSLFSCSTSENTEMLREREVCVFDSLARECVAAARRTQYDSAYVWARRMLAEAGRTASVDDSLEAFAYIVDVFDYCSEYDSSRYYIGKGKDLLAQCKSRGVELASSRPVYMLYNAEGVVALQSEYNFEKAVSCFLKGLEYTDNYHEGSVLAINLIVTSFFKGTVDGLEYVSDMYETGCEEKDTLMLFYGAYGLAMMETVQGRYHEAVRFVEEAAGYNRLKQYTSEYVLQALYGNILGKLGERDKAGKILEDVYDGLLEDRQESTSLIYVCMSYAEYLLSCGDYKGAVEVGERGLDIAVKFSNKIFNPQLYMCLSKAYSSQKNWKRALEYYEMYDEESRVLFDVQQEWVTKELTIRYQTAEKEAQLQQARVSLMKRNREYQITLFVVLIAVIILFFLILLYRHKNKMYLRIVRQYNESIRKERELQSELDELRGNAAGTKDACSNEELFFRLEAMMRNEHIYRKKYLTRDEVVEMMKTNRTYLSQVVNEKTGKSFNQYVNSYRIAEAVSILSDVSSDVPLKAVAGDAGFSSLTTFYKIFREEVGMTPAKYREKVLELYSIDKKIKE